jgi:hypothetical protein
VTATGTLPRAFPDIFARSRGALPSSEKPGYALIMRFHFGPLASGALLAFVAACNLVPPTPLEPVAPVALITPDPPSPSPLALANPSAPPLVLAPPSETVERPEPRRFGKKIRSTEMVSLAAVAAAPKQYNHRSIVTEGIVTKVCQEAGCWMAIKDESKDTLTAMVRMENHAFFMPKDAPGKHARLEGRILLVKDGKECDESEAERAELSMEAVGVELADR